MKKYSDYSTKELDNLANVRTKKKKQSSNGVYFVTALAITLSLLSAFTLFILFVYKPNKSEKPVGDPVSNIHVNATNDDCLNLVIYVTEENEKELKTAFLVRADFVSNAVPIIALPPNTSVTQRESEYSIKEIFEKDAENGLTLCLKENFDINLTRYITVNYRQIAEFLNVFGSVDYSIPYDIEYKEDERVVFLNKGLVSLDFDKIKMLLSFDDFTEGTQLKYQLASHISSLFINKYITRLNDTKMDDCVKYITNNSRNNLSVIDFANRKSLVTNLAQAKNNPAYGLYLSGEYSKGDEYYLLSDKLKSQIAAIYK